jgi:putative ATP-binding cassette transporter
MSEIADKPQSVTERLLDISTAGVWPQFASLLRGIKRAPERWVLLSFPILATLVIGAIAAGQVRLNAWQGALYDALQRYDLGDFLHLIVVFLMIVAGLLCLVVAQTWLTEVSKVKLRAWLTRDLLDEWLRPKHAYLLAFAGDDGVNPDQRIQEDARHLSELSADLGGGLAQATLLLLGFIGVLWVLSAQVVFNLEGREFTIPGYMVWCALAYASAGSWLTWRVGRPLIDLNARHYAREAEFRVALVRVVEHAESISLYRGEADERASLDTILASVLTVTRNLAGGVARLTWITSGHGWLAIIFPFLMAAPGYFGGKLTLGSLVIVVGAFNRCRTHCGGSSTTSPGLPIGAPRSFAWWPSARPCALWTASTRPTDELNFPITAKASSLSRRSRPFYLSQWPTALSWRRRKSSSHPAIMSW